MFPSTLDSFSPFCCLLFFNRAGLYVDDHLMWVACSAAQSSRSPERLVQTMLSALSYLLHSVGGYRDPQWTAVSPSLQIVLELLSHLRLIAGTSPFTGPACSCTNPADLLVISLTSSISATVLASYHPYLLERSGETREDVVHLSVCLNVCLYFVVCTERHLRLQLPFRASS